MNRLSGEKSAYLRHAAHQKIDWYPWGKEAFQKAKEEDKPVFLSTGAVWCHWCHVMAKECFEDQEIADFLNGNFISIKLDRDERPDVDRRYQQAVSAMGSGGGWPLSVFLTPDKRPFFGGTYFPPEDAHGRPGFGKILREVFNYYKTRKEEIAEYTGRLINFLMPDPLPQGPVDMSYVDGAEEDILNEHDSQNGGFGVSPKFPMPGAIEFLINRYYFVRNESLGNAVMKTLIAMARGGFHDQLQGGFHRYSTDESWIIPHFEKMADDNAWLLKNYISAYNVFGNIYFREVAEGIISFLKNIMTDPEGGFYMSQDADVTPDDEGGYFTWTEEDFKNVLDGEEYKVLSSHLMNENGSMHHNKSKKVLFIASETDEIARELEIDSERVSEIINLGKEKLLSERSKREAPFVDTTLYTSINGMLISSCIYAYRTLKDSWLRDFSLNSLERIMKTRFINGNLQHSEGVKAVLDDYIFLVEALLSAYEITGEVHYLERSDDIMDLCIKNLWDKREGGFFDSEDPVLGIRLKGIEDIPHPSANSSAIILLLKLADMTGKYGYFDRAETALKIFSSRAKDMGIHSGYYYCALDAFYSMLKLNVETSKDSDLAEAVVSSHRPYMNFIYGEDKGSVTLCKRGICLEPIRTAESLENFLENGVKGGETG
jgi:uncharacterized protein YyaL (SSP411 family)